MSPARGTRKGDDCGRCAARARRAATARASATHCRASAARPATRSASPWSSAAQTAASGRGRNQGPARAPPHRRRRRKRQRPRRAASTAAPARPRQPRRVGLCGKAMEEQRPIPGAHRRGHARAHRRGLRSSRAPVCWRNALAHPAAALFYGELRVRFRRNIGGRERVRRRRERGRHGLQTWQAGARVTARVNVGVRMLSIVATSRRGDAVFCAARDRKCPREKEDGAAAPSLRCSRRASAGWPGRGHATAGSRYVEGAIDSAQGTSWVNIRAGVGSSIGRRQRAAASRRWRCCFAPHACYAGQSNARSPKGDPIRSMGSRSAAAPVNKISRMTSLHHCWRRRQIAATRSGGRPMPRSSKQHRLRMRG